MMETPSSSFTTPTTTTKTTPFTHYFKTRLDQITTLTQDSCLPSLSVEGLVDTLFAIYTDCKSLSTQSPQVTAFVQKYDKIVTKIQALRVNTQDFEVVQTLATGAVGKVCLVREKHNKTVYAMKVLKKIDLLTRREAAFFMEERNALVYAQSSQWLTTLYAAFQDEQHLYLVMEYASGGSLRSLMNNRETTMDEVEARFYIGEILLALDELHKLNFIHRDVKPDNCLIDSTGHIKLADFGSCMRLDDTNRVTSTETVGTPDYISPEILRAQEGGVSYGKECDWWSLGIILYELLFDEVPFYAESLTQSYGKIMDHEKHFAFPDDIEVSEIVIDLMKRIICNHEVRLGRKNTDEIKSHKWFQGFEWENIRNTKAPFVPELSGPDDTRYFEDEEDESKKIDLKAKARGRDYTGQNLPFVGYTYVQNARPVVHLDSGGSPLSIDTFSSSTLSSTSSSDAVSMARISQLEAQLNAALKINEAAAKQPPIDSEVLKKDAAARIQLEEKVSSLEKENKNLSSKIKQMTLDHGYEKDERVELNKKIEELQHSLDNEIKLNLDLQEAVESKRQLEKDIASLKTDIDNEKTTAKKVSEALAEVFKDKALLELEVGQTRRQLKDQVVADEEAEKQFVSVKSQLEVEIKHRAEAEKECDTLRLEVSELKTRLEESNDSAEYLERTVKTLQDTNADIERERAMISVELSTTMQKLKDVAAEKERQISKIVEEKKQGELESIESLKSELENSNSKIHSLSEEISQLTKEKAVLELGKTEISKKLAAESSAVADIKSKLQAAERRTVDQDQKIQQITESSTKTGNKATQLQTELNSLMQQLRDARANLSITSLKLGSMEKSNTMLQTDLSDMKTKYIAEVNLGADLQIKVKELELSLTNERKTRIQAESTARSTENEKKDIKSAVQRLQARVLVLKDECTAALQQQQAAEARLHAVEAQLEAQISTQSSIKTKFEKDNSELAAALHESKMRLEDEAERLSHTEHMNEQYKIQIDELALQIKEDMSLQSKLNHRISELESVLQDQKPDKNNLRIKSDNPALSRSATDLLSLATPSPTKSGAVSGTPPGASATTTSSSRAFKFKSVLFGNKKSEHDKERERALQKIQDMEDEIKREKENSHSRKASTSTMASSIWSGQTRQSDYPSNASAVSAPPTQYEYNPSDPLRGFIKVPKQGKVKKGWKKVYAVVRDYKFFTYDKEKDADDIHAKPLDVIDLRSDIFYAMDVTQAELIHANSKDIDSIFKLHYANNPIKSEILASPKKPSAFDFDSLFQDDKLVPTPSVEVTDAAEAVAVTTVPTKADKYSKRQSMKAGSVGTGDGSNSKRHTIQFLGRLNMSSSVNNLSEKPSGKNGLAAAASLGIANEATRKRISQLQTMIAMEEKYATGAMAIISAATNENQKALAMQQLDLFHRNIDKWKVELDQLVAEHHSSQATLADQMKSPSLEGLDSLINEQDAADWRKDLEEEIKKKYQEKEAVRKMALIQGMIPASAPLSIMGISPKSSLGGGGRSSAASSRDADHVLENIEKDINRLREELSTLKSNDQSKISTLLKMLNERAALSSCNGHHFKKKVMNKPMDCSRCREALWLPSDGAKTAVECEVCHALCHNYCKMNFDVSCQHYVVLKDVTPLYFMAADTTDRNRWIAGIQYYVKDNERKSTVYYPGSPNTHTMPTPPITVTPEMETHLTAILQNHVRMVRKSATARERSPTVAGTPPSDQTLDGIATAIHDSSQEDDNDTHEARRRRIMSIDEGSNIIGLYADDKDSREASFSKKSSIQDLSDKNNYISSAHLSLSTSGTANDVCESPMESVQSHSVGDKPTLEQQHHSSLLTVSLTQSASFSTSQHSRPLSTSRIVSRSTSKNSSSAAALTAATTTTATATAAPPSTSPTSSSFERKQAFRNVSVSRVPTEDPLNGANVRRVNTMGSVSNSNGVNRPQPNDRSG